MTRATFDPFAQHLDRDRALTILRDAVAGAEDGELFLERSRSESLTFDDGRLRNSSYMAGQGFGLRAV
ncbi:MAG: PmbA/TldA family metallopeptidase, partial [Paracoccus sp. (in: a-proteobacteria)]